MVCKHNYKVDQYGPSPKSGKDVPQLRKCEKCGKRQYKVWKFNPITGQYNVHWRSS